MAQFSLQLHVQPYVLDREHPAWDEGHKV